tara:strand:- start:19094 stop:20029 length:936 start_codon:yes stop_codon:yes gene_type:complete
MKINLIITKSQLVKDLDSEKEKTNLRGPRSAVTNLIKGLNDHGANYGITFDEEKASGKIGEVNIPLNINSLNILYKQSEEILKTSVIGPMGVGNASDRLPIFQKIKKCLIHSNWVKTLYLKQLGDAKIFDVDFYLWAAGIDTDFFKPENIKKDLDCFIYHKSGPIELSWLKESLDKYKIKYEILQYGKYTQKELKNISNRSNFCIHSSLDETQNMAAMEILSCNVPMIIFDSNYRHHVDFCTSLEYFDETCGIKVNQNDFYDHRPDAIDKPLNEMIENYSKYTPRDYILKNHTIEKSTKQFLKAADWVAND